MDYLKSLVSIFFVINFLILKYDIALAEDDLFDIEDFPTEEVKVLQYPELTREYSDVAFKAVILGNLIHLDPEHRFIYIKPREFDLPRMYVYLDRLTKYTYASLGVRKRARISSLIEGDRVGVKLFTKQGIAVAEEIFLIEGEFEPLSHYDRKMYSVKK